MLNYPFRVGGSHEAMHFLPFLQQFQVVTKRSCLARLQAPTQNGSGPVLETPQRAAHTPSIQCLR
jgi:hypothetical protein